MFQSRVHRPDSIPLHRTRGQCRTMIQALLCALLGAAGIACGPKSKPEPKASHDAAVVKAAADAAARRVVARPRPISIGGGCSCIAIGVDPADVKGLRKALVSRMDGLNGALRAHMAKIDTTVPDVKKDHIAQPEALHKARRQVGCRLDCLLHQFEGATSALWSYVEVAALFLDTARRAVQRLATPPDKRPKGPTLSLLTRLFNRVARTSNESIGLSLLERRTPATVVGVDASSFKAKTRRWRDQLQVRLSVFRRGWLPLVQQKKPEGPALRHRVRLRVALARLRQSLQTRIADARTIACKRGAGCAKPQARWIAVLAATTRLVAHLQLTATTLRQANPGVSLAQGRRLSTKTEKAFGALQKAANDL